MCRFIYVGISYENGAPIRDFELYVKKGVHDEQQQGSGVRWCHVGFSGLDEKKRDTLQVAASNLEFRMYEFSVTSFHHEEINNQVTIFSNL
jgi:hypothetical protein